MVGGGWKVPLSLPTMMTGELFEKATEERRRSVCREVIGSSVLTEMSHTSSRPSPVTEAKTDELSGLQQMSAT